MSLPNHPPSPVPTMHPSGTMSLPPTDVAWTDPSQRTPLTIFGLLVLLLIAAYWDMLAMVSSAWQEDALYSHGYIVPVFALALMWMRWQPFRPVPIVERWWGLAILVGALLARLPAVYVAMNPLDRISFPIAIVGALLLVGGWHTLRWAWPGPLFLVFMFPLPSAAEQLVLWKLQTLASVASTFVLQTLGVAAFREGNLITVPGVDPLNIAEACSGLRMVTIFFSMALAMIFLIERPWWDKFVILLSAIPIALVVNVIRITLTGLLYVFVGSDSHFAQKLAHDWAGFFMMPLALGFLWAELQILERLTIPIDAAQLRPIGARAATIHAR